MYCRESGRGFSAGNNIELHIYSSLEQRPPEDWLAADWSDQFTAAGMLM